MAMEIDPTAPPAPENPNRPGRARRRPDGAAREPEPPGSDSDPDLKPWPGPTDPENPLPGPDPAPWPDPTDPEQPLPGPKPWPDPTDPENSLPGPLRGPTRPTRRTRFARRTRPIRSRKYRRRGIRRTPPIQCPTPSSSRSPARSRRTTCPSTEAGGADQARPGSGRRHSTAREPGRPLDAPGARCMDARSACPGRNGSLRRSRRRHARSTLGPEPVIERIVDGPCDDQGHREVPSAGAHPARAKIKAAPTSDQAPNRAKLANLMKSSWVHVLRD